MTCRLLVARLRTWHYSLVFGDDTLGHIIYYCGRDDEKALQGEKERDWKLRRRI
jgi:hypothetical protein